MYKAWNFLTNYSFFLLGGALIGLIWANLDSNSYHDMVEFVLLDDFFIGHPYEAGGRLRHTLTVNYLVNDVLMALFFAVAAKEIWEAAILRNGALRGRKSATPLFATLGGILGPVAVYLGAAAMLGAETFTAVQRGWAIPAATDLAVCYLVGRTVFGADHPALPFLLLLAIADDVAGLAILTIFYPSGDLALHWLSLSAAASAAAFVLFNWMPRVMDRGRPLRPNSTWVRRKLSFWPYLGAGALSWYAFQRSGLQPALGLLPVIPAIPHANRAFGVFSEAEQYLTDLLNHIELLLKHPVEIVLFLFGLMNAGVEFATVGTTTWLVLAGFLIGKPLGITLFGWFAARPLKLGLPSGMRMADLFVVGSVASIGLTVSLFIASDAFDGSVGPEGINMEDAAKMGVLLSFTAAILSVVAARLLNVRKRSG